MNEKLSFQHLVDALSTKANVSKKVAETFSKAFFDTVVDALYMGESSIKVKGLGTFKLIEVESRESVNVSNGERIIIPGYKKVSFVPEDSVVEVLNRKEETEESNSEVAVPKTEVTAQISEVIAPVSDVDALVSVIEEIDTKENLSTDNLQQQKSNEVSSSQKADDDDFIKLVEAEEPVRVEAPSDALSGIDLLISTPESIEEVRRDYEAARLKADEAVEIARKANAERVRLKMLLDRLEKNFSPEVPTITVVEKPIDIHDSVEESHVAEDNPPEKNVSNPETVAADESVLPKEGESHVEDEEQTGSDESADENNVKQEGLADETSGDGNKAALDRLLTAEEEPVNSKDRKSYWIVWLLCSFAVLVLVSCIVFFMYKTSESIESVEQVIVTNNDSIAVYDSANEVAASVASDSLSVTGTDEIKKDIVDSGKEKTNEPKENRPKTYVLKKGDSLTKLSVKFYGTKDSVSAIIKANGFENPNNVLVGATIKLP